MNCEYSHEMYMSEIQIIAKYFFHWIRIRQNVIKNQSYMSSLVCHYRTMFRVVEFGLSPEKEVAVVSSSWWSGDESTGQGNCLWPPRGSNVSYMVTRHIRPEDSWVKHSARSIFVTGENPNITECCLFVLYTGRWCDKFYLTFSRVLPYSLFHLTSIFTPRCVDQ